MYTYLHRNSPSFTFFRRAASPRDVVWRLVYNTYLDWRMPIDRTETETERGKGPFPPHMRI
jgi:hypothetical protein